MKKIIKKMIEKIRTFKRSFENSQKIKSAKKIAEKHGFSILELMGQGKDSIIFKAEKNNNFYVVKVLSSYAKVFLPVTKDLFLKTTVHETNQIPEFFSIKILNDEILYYPFLDLKNSNTNPKELLIKFAAVCDFESRLLSYGFVMWDFGFSGVNYLFSNGSLKIIDYGGNAFLYLNEPKFTLPIQRENLLLAKNQFIQQALLLHFIVLGIGQTSATKWASWIQDNSNLAESQKVIEQYLLGTIYEKLGKIVFSLDLTTKEDWLSLKKQIEDYFNEKSVLTLDKADIDKVFFEKDQVKVTGYQNYILSRKHVEPLDKGHQWANTEVKWSIISNQLKRLKFSSYLDIGSNLGLYVFTANVLCGAKATGIDYNKEYIENCKKIADHLQLNCQFMTCEFSKISTQFDCVSMLGVIHHIYSRTESYGNLEEIIKKLSQISNKYVILEFPTENDLKAMKWIHIPSRETTNDYTLKNFINLANKYFSEIELVDATTQDRPVYLLTK